MLVTYSDECWKWFMLVTVMLVQFVLMTLFVPVITILNYASTNITLSPISLLPNFFDSLTLILNLRTLFGFFMIARSTLGGAIDGDVNLKIGILMMSMFFGGFIGSNLSGLLIDRFTKFKIIGIAAISAGKI